MVFQFMWEFILCILSPVSDENLKKSIKQMDTQLKQLETDLKSLKKSGVDGDRFQDVMNISFVLLL